MGLRCFDQVTINIVNNALVVTSVNPVVYEELFIKVMFFQHVVGSEMLFCEWMFLFWRSQIILFQIEKAFSPAAFSFIGSLL